MTDTIEHVFLPQYAAQAVAEFEHYYALVKKINRTPDVPDGVFQYVDLCKHFAQMIREAVHIVLPPNGEIYRKNTTGATMPTKDECESLFGLPGPIVCLEYPWTYLPDAGMKAPKRITLIVDGKQIVEEHERGPGRVFAMNFFSIVFDDQEDMWVLSDIGLTLAQPFEAVQTESGSGWGFKGCIRNVSEGTEIWPGSKYGDQIVTEKVYKRMISEFYPDVIAAVQCCHSLRAGARMEERTEPSASRRRKFEKKGVGGFTYHVLKIPRIGIVSSHLPKGGSHASPRFHVRRAHIRKLSTGVLTFVRQHFVGDADRGTVDKSYQLGGKENG